MRTPARSIEGEVQVDFTGGLRLTEEGERMEQNELREALNMFPINTGGIERRGGFMPFAGLPDAPVSEMVEYVNPDGDAEVWVEVDNGSAYRILPGVSRTIQGLPGTVSSGRLRGVQIGEYLYFGRGSGWNAWHRWDGTTATTLPNAMRLDSEDHLGTGLPDFTTFTQPGIPAADRIQVWDGRAWIGGLDGNSASVYFSFTFGAGDREGQEDFYENWAYHLEPDGRDNVMAMVPLGGRMFVFLRNSIHMFSPYQGERTDFYYSVQRFDSRIGMVGPNAFAVSGNAIWFYDREEGLMSLTGEGVLSGHMSKIAHLQKSLPADLSDVAVGYWEGKVWVSFPGTTGTYIYDANLDAWSQHSVSLTSFHSYRPTGSSQPTGRLIGAAVHATANTVLDLEGDNTHALDYYTDAISETIESSFKTAWLDTEVPEAIKDWKAMEVVYRARFGQEVRTRAITDWNPFALAREWTQDVSNTASWDDGLETVFSWVTVSTGIFEPLYAGSSAPVYPSYTEQNVLTMTPQARPAHHGEVTGPAVGNETRLALPVRTRRICGSRAVSLEFRQEASVGKWGVDRISLFYSRKLVRV